MIIYIYILFFLVYSFSLSTYVPYIWPDEVLFYSPSFNLLTNGLMSTSVMEGLIPGMERYTLWMPPLYILLQSVFFFIFSSDITYGRILSTLIGSGSIYVLWKLLKNLKLDNKIIHASILLLSTDFLFIRVSHTARMEGLCLLLALLSILTLFNAVSSKDHIKSLLYFLSGLLLSLSFLSHPFGITFSFLIVYLLYSKKELTVKNLSIYFIGGMIPLSFWLAYIIPNFELFLIQFGSQLSRKKELFGVFSQLTKFKIIFSSFEFPIFKAALLFFVSGTYLFYYKHFKNSISLFLFFWLFIVSFFIYISSESWYVYYLTVPLSILTALLLFHNNKVTKSIFIINASYNIIVLFWIILSNFIIWDTPKATTLYFQELDSIIQNRDRIYLQSIPDPYFYLKKKYPKKDILEFIPGELPVISDKFQEVISNREVFVFYKEELMNSYIKTFLEENKDKYTRKEIKIEGGRYPIISYIYFTHKE